MFMDDRHPTTFRRSRTRRRFAILAAASAIAVGVPAGDMSAASPGGHADAVVVSRSSLRPRVVSRPPVATVTVGTTFSYRPRATGRTPMRWSLVRGPHGMNVSHRNGAVTWTPLRPGTFAVTLLLRNGFGSARHRFPLAVAAAPAPPVVLAAGDIASCGSDGDEHTARILDEHPAATVLTLGDNAYEAGTPVEFANCYAPTWGRHRSRTHPAPGNHDYGTADAAGYFGYFGEIAGATQKGYYSFDLGAWHLVSLNSERDFSAGGAQLAWLRADLATTTKRCVLAYWHKPRFTTGNYRDFTDYAPFWHELGAMGAEIVLNGHDHNYQRFRPMTSGGAYDPVNGIREFVVGTGGRSLYALGADPRREAASSSAGGVLELTLRADGYDWSFIPVAGQLFTDSGSGACR
jgi:hypothetical protein